MIKFLLISFILLQNASAQNVDSLLNLHFIARGGLSKIKAVESIKMSGKASINKTFADYTIIIQRPNFIRIELNAENTELVQAFDGNRAWIYAPKNGINLVQDMGVIEKERLISEAEIDGPLIDYKEKGIKIEYDGTENVDGRFAHILKLFMPNGTIKRIYIDKKTHQSIKESSFRTIKGNTPLATSLVKVESLFDNYTYQNELAVAKVITTYMDGKILTILKIDKVEFNLKNLEKAFKPDGLPAN